MLYDKPEVLFVGSALDVVGNPCQRKEPPYLDDIDFRRFCPAPPPACPADE